MAAQVLSNSHASFSPASENYTSAMYQQFPNYSNYVPTNQSGFVYNDEAAQNVNLSSAETWSDQSNNLRRISSRSPNLQHDRTPIRHHKSSMSRPRSTSKSDALLAYATEQSLQQQALHRTHSANTTPQMPQTTPQASPGLFSTQNYGTLSPASPYVQQNHYYGATPPQYNDMTRPTINNSPALQSDFGFNRSESHISPLSNSGIPPNDGLYMQSSGQTGPTSIPGMTTTAMGYQPISRSMDPPPGAIEISSSRNKPQCWDHGCNGRQFSTFSNLLRHQREKSGTATKAICPHCRTEFTRTTARNGHMYGGKCKGMPDAKQSPDADATTEH